LTWLVRKFGLRLAIPTLLSIALPLASSGKDKIAYGEGLIVNIPMPVAEVQTVIEDVAENGVIRGTKEYNKDEFVGGAVAANSPRVFPPWTEQGKVFYKVRLNALDPRNFKDGGDVGTLEVRYVVSPQGDKNTVLRIDALFQEDFRRVVHQSNGSVETSEYKDIREHLDTIEVMKQQNIEAEKERQEALARKQNRPMQSMTQSNTVQSNMAQSDSSSSSSSQTAPTETAQNVPQTAEARMEATRVEVPVSAETAPPPASGEQLLTMEQRVKALRKEISRSVKSPGSPLKSAPFHTAGTLQLLPPGTEVLILINTPYWYGVETHEGQHGWILRDDLEQQP
jgi:hypothetical protein